MTDEAQQLPYPDNDGQTHYDGCWQERGHHNCAVRAVLELQIDADDLRKENSELKTEIELTLKAFGQNAMYWKRALDGVKKQRDELQAENERLREDVTTITATNSALATENQQLIEELKAAKGRQHD